MPAVRRLKGGDVVRRDALRLLGLVDAKSLEQALLRVYYALRLS